MGKVLDLQKELWERVARQARKLGTAGNPALRKAVDEFEQSFPDHFRKLATERFVERARRSPFLLIGDYHTLPRAQIVAARFLEAYRPRCLALEIIPSSHQAALDTWARGDAPAAALLAAVRFQSHWGKVPTRGYEILLETGREHRARLLALDHPASGSDVGPAFLDREEAMLARLVDVARPRCLALIGDLHLHPMCIPDAIGADRCTVLHQNHAPYHFALMQDELELPALLQLTVNRYVYQHTHPLLVEESCLTALCGQSETHVASPEEWLPALLARVAGLLGLDPPPPPTVIATFDPDQRDLLTLLVPDERETTTLLDRLFIQGMSFLTDAGPLILHLPGSNHLAEAAGKWISLTECRLPRDAAPRALHWLAQTRLEAAGFLASLLVNPMRRGKSLAWYRDFLDVKLNWRQTTRWHEQLEASLDEPQSIFPLRSLPAPGAPIGLVVTRVLGQELGRRLHETLEKDRAGRDRVLAALFHPLSELADLQPALEALHDASGGLRAAAWTGSRRPADVS